MNFVFKVKKVEISIPMPSMVLNEEGGDFVDFKVENLESQVQGNVDEISRVMSELASHVVQVAASIEKQKANKIVSLTPRNKKN